MTTLWQTFVTLTAVGAWTGCMVWLVRSTRPEAEPEADVDSEPLPPGVLLCDLCDDVACERHRDAETRRTINLCDRHARDNRRLDSWVLKLG